MTSWGVEAGAAAHRPPDCDWDRGVTPKVKQEANPSNSDTLTSLCHSSSDLHRKIPMGTHREQELARTDQDPQPPTSHSSILRAVVAVVMATEQPPTATLECPHLPGTTYRQRLAVPSQTHKGQLIKHTHCSFHSQENAFSYRILFSDIIPIQMGMGFSDSH